MASSDALFSVIQPNTRTVACTEYPDLILRLGNSQCLVRKATAAKVLQVFDALPAEQFWESNAAIVTVNEDLDHHALELILRAAHEEAVDCQPSWYAARPNFLPELAVACEYYKCSYLVCENFKRLLKLPALKKAIDPKVNYMPAFIACYRLGWADEFSQLYKIILTSLHISGENNEHRAYREDTLLNRTLGLTYVVKASLIASRKNILEVFLQAAVARMSHLHDNALIQPFCSVHPTRPCQAFRLATMRCLLGTGGIYFGVEGRPDTTESDIRFSISKLMADIQAHTEENEGAQPGQCDLKGRWVKDKLQQFVDNEQVPETLLALVRRNSSR